MSVETEKYKGFKIEIEFDTDPQDPFIEWDMLGTYACYHPRYSLGTEQDIKSGQDILDKLKQDKPVVCLPLYLYEHGGITISTTTAGIPDVQWDVSSVGVMYVTAQQIRENWMVKRATKKLREDAEKILRSQLETYDDYLRGAVYGYRVVDSEGEEIDACWGFYGYDHENSGLMDTARNAIDCERSRLHKERLNQLKNWIKNKVPLYVREQALV